MKKAGTKLTVALMALLISTSSVSANQMMPVPGDFYFRGKVKTLMDMRFHNIKRQKHDFSCGSAALASLLTYHYRRPVEEKAVIEVMYRNGDKEKIRREGFSLLDMKNYLLSLGLRANGYQQDLDKLVKVGIPAIVLINRKGYMHFVLVQGVTKNKVLIGDPALGRKVVKRKEFEKMWENKILFVVDDDMRTARKTFNTEHAWNTKKLRDYSTPLSNANLASTTLFTSYTPNTYPQ